MIVLVNPRVTHPRNRRFPLSVMAVGAALPPEMDWAIIDGNRPGVDPFLELDALIRARRGTRQSVRAVAMSVMPGPQLVSAVALAKQIKHRHPDIPVVWGGYFPSLYPKPVINAPYVDWAIRGQGERSFVELLDVLNGHRDPTTVAGLAFREPGGNPWIGPERAWVGPDELPPPPYHRIDVDDYILPTFLGRRSAVYQTSIGCPYACKFCGVIAAYGSRQRVETPARTIEHLSYLVRDHGVDAIHFYDNNFFLTEARAVELAERLRPLGLRWWCEARIDAVVRFSDRTWELLKRSGLTMVFFGAESGSDAVLKQMSKHLTTDKTIEVARRTREVGIIPEFSFVLGNPADPERDVGDTLAFIRRLKAINPRMELVTYFYTPTPQRRGTYGDVDPLAGTPTDLDDWTRPEWVAWMTHENPQLSWLTDRLKARVRDFKLILSSRFPSVHDRRTRNWGKVLGQALSWERWRRERYDNPRLLRAIRSFAKVEEDRPDEYGHLRPPVQ